MKGHFIQQNYLKVMTFTPDPHRRPAFHQSLKALLSMGIGGLLTLAFAPHAQAAEEIVLNYQWLRRSLPVSDLSTLAETGEPSPQLSTYLDAIGQRPDAFRRTLTREVSLDPVLLDRMLNNPVGDLALDQLSPIIHTRSREGDRQALRSALILSASDDGKVSLVELIETYPTQELHVDGDRLADAYNDIADLRDRIDRWTAWLDIIQ